MRKDVTERLPLETVISLEGGIAGMPIEVRAVILAQMWLEGRSWANRPFEILRLTTTLDYCLSDLLERCRQLQYVQSDNAALYRHWVRYLETIPGGCFRIVMDGLDYLAAKRHIYYHQARKCFLPIASLGRIID